MSQNIDTTELKIPNHIAIIPDGNRRWAKAKGLPSFEGHRQGAEASKRILRKANELGVHTMTFWGFSTENWNRAADEVDQLMALFEEFLDQNLEEAMKNEARIIHLGRKDRIREPLISKIIEAEEKTKDFKNHVLNIALDYGGHDEIMRAVKKIVADVENHVITIDDVSKEVGKYENKYPFFLFKNYLDTKDQPFPYPDLVIRTSGEMRFSGFLPWQIAYSELYFTNLCLPDFSGDELMKAIEQYNGRDRRFGGNTPAK